MLVHEQELHVYTMVTDFSSCHLCFVVVVVFVFVLSCVMSCNSETTYKELAASSKTLRLSSCLAFPYLEIYLL